LIALAKQAGEAILVHYRRLNEVRVQQKSDASPLTEADIAAHQIIEQGLHALTPELPVLSEESTAIDFNERRQWQRYWLVDPLDGTKEFLAHNDEFTVNIALIDNHEPILSVVYAPAKMACYYACVGEGAFYQQGKASAEKLNAQPAAQTVKVLASRRHDPQLLQQFLTYFPSYERVHVGSSLKFCLIAAGKADVYPRFGETSEWDTAAAQCILEAVGGRVVDLHGQRLMYNTKNNLLNPPFMAYADNDVDWLAFLKDKP